MINVGRYTIHGWYGIHMYYVFLKYTSGAADDFLSVLPPTSNDP